MSIWFEPIQAEKAIAPIPQYEDSLKSENNATMPYLEENTEDGYFIVSTTKNGLQANLGTTTAIVEPQDKIFEECQVLVKDSPTRIEDTWDCYLNK